MVHRFLIVIAMSMIGLTSSDFSIPGDTSTAGSPACLAVLRCDVGDREIFFALVRAIAR